VKSQGVFLRAMAAGSDEAVVDIVGVIGWEVGMQQIKAILSGIPDTVQRVIFDIYSPGGDVWEGNGIIQEIGSLKQHTLARIQVAASMATLIAVACKERVIAGNGRFLIHNAWTQTTGDAAAHEKRAKELRDCEIEAANFYAARTGKTAEEMLALMGEERWLTADEALSFGFATSKNDPFAEKDYEAVRQEITAAGKWPQALVEILVSKEEPHGNEAAPGAKNEERGGVVEPPPPVHDFAAQLTAAADRARADGVSEGRAAAVAEYQAAVERLNAKIKAQESLLRDLQSAKDRAEARAVAAEKGAEDRCKKLREQLDAASARLSKFVDAAASFSPAIESWEEAMRASGGDYEKAAKQYPDLLKRYEAEHRQKRNK